MNIPIFCVAAFYTETIISRKYSSNKEILSALFRVPFTVENKTKIKTKPIFFSHNTCKFDVY